MNKEASGVLYYADSIPIKRDDIESALESIGLEKGDVIMIHSDVGSFGKLGTPDRNSLLQALIDSIKNVVGEEGTIIMPTFTYSFDKNENFDVENSKSTVGALTEYFRNQPDVSRTVHPTHSVAVWGKYKNDLLNIGKGTFDKDSIFGKVHKMNSKFVSFGVPLYKSCTFVHYIECMHGVPYRYMRKFRGKIISGNKEYEDEISFCYKYTFIFNSMLKFEQHLQKKGLLKEIKVGKSKISTIRYDVLFNEGCKLLDENIYFFLKNDTLFFKLFNFLIDPILKYTPWLTKLLDKVAIKIIR